MAEFFNEYGALLWEGTLETLYMTFVPTLVAYLIGLPLGVLMVAGEEGGVRPLPRPLMWILNVIINILRSVPFLILGLPMFDTLFAIIRRLAEKHGLDFMNGNIVVWFSLILFK